MINENSVSNERLKMIFGFILLLSLVVLAGAIALGTVKEKSSYGLMPIVTALATLAGGFSNWAFGTIRHDKGDPDK